MRLSLLQRSLRRRLWRDERGQNIVLGGLMLLFVFMAVLLTFSVGYRVREKVKLQALADSGAYSDAVAEARLFNYFSFTNRARVGHDVAILSLHAHASYITWMEDLYYKTATAHDEVGGMLELIGAVCPESGDCCEDLSDGYNNFHSAGGEFKQAGEDLHQQWHDPNGEDTTWMELVKQHYNSISSLAKDQSGLWKDLNTRFESLPSDAAQKVDKNIQNGTGGVKVTKQHLLDATGDPGNWGPGEDWKEIVSATRYNSWVVKRSFKEGGKWMQAKSQSMSDLGECQRTVLYVSDSGNAKTAKSSSSYDDVHSNIHQTPDGKEGWGPSAGYAAEDHGSVLVMGYCDCPMGVGGGSVHGGLISGPQAGSIPYHFYGHNDDNKSQPDPHDIGGCSNGDDDSTCGIYVRHPRFIYGSADYDPDKLWNQPHTVVVLTKDTNTMKPQGAAKQPFDFDVNLAIPVPVSFRTNGNKGDTDAGKMAAIAGGLVYYHKPGGDGWQEPPSFWNPYWRAKLHPIRPDDATTALGDDQSAAKDEVKFINY